MSDRIQIGIYSHDGEYIDTLLDSEEIFEGQAYDPRITLKANGLKDLSLTIPLKILSKDRKNYIDNPRWEYLTKQYKVRVNDYQGTHEYVLRSYTENHSSDDHLTIDATFMSLAEFELTQIGYEINFDENTLYMYALGEDPNDPDVTPVGVYNSDIHFWEEKLLAYAPSWKYRVESYYELDTEMEIDNRQGNGVPDPNDPELKTGTEQFYEDNRIVSYNDNNEPIYKDYYEIKQRILTASKSSVWNIQQDICEKFECWPSFEIVYDEDYQIVSKTIVLKNDLPDDALFNVEYKKNLESLEREVDSSSIVTKMYVTSLDSDNADEGLITIANNSKNYMKESYLLDLSWYLGDNTTDEDLVSQEIINPNLKMIFSPTKYATPEITENIYGEDTKDVYKKYQANIRRRNIYIENKSLELSKAQEELTNLKSQLELYSSEYDAAQEQVNDILSSIATCPAGPQQETNRRCYIYVEDGVRIVKFSEVGVRENELPTEFFTPVNLHFTTNGQVRGDKVTSETVSQISWEPYKFDEVLHTVTAMKVNNVMAGPEQNYGCFSCTLVYYPLEFYIKLENYWRAQADAAKKQKELLGEPEENGGVVGLIPEKQKEVRTLKHELYNAQQEKAEVVKEFETLMSPFIREGYWQDTDYAIYTNQPMETGRMNPVEQPLVNKVLQKVDWSKKKLCFKIPNREISTIITVKEKDENGNIVEKEKIKKANLYDLIDINSIEIMNDNPAAASVYGNFKTYVKGTDFDVEYGYVAYKDKAEDIQPSDYESNRGIYATFTQSMSIRTDLGVGLDKDVNLLVRAKARGGGSFIFSEYIKPQFDDNRGGRPWFAEMERILEVKAENLVLSNVKVEINTVAAIPKQNYIDAKTEAQKRERVDLYDSNYELVYGTDYYTYKESDDKGNVISKIHLNTTTNVPLGSKMAIDDAFSCFNITYEQDVTAKFYYNDALETLKQSCIPQVTYSINVLDISTIQNPNLKVKNFIPKVGTRVPIYDPELRFYGMKGFIDEVSYDLLDPANTILTITNFKNKFEDLFEKITAATVAVESKEYQYDNVASALTPTGELKVDLLTNSLLQNNLALALSPNNDVVWDNSGITVTNKDLNENGIYGKLRITSYGIFIANRLDENGNYAWTTAITPDFINANVITAGNLNTQQVQIYNSTEPRFIWNSTGLYAYGETKDGATDYNQYVLFNDKGLTFRELTKQLSSYSIFNLLRESFIYATTGTEAGDKIYEGSTEGLEPEIKELWENCQWYTTQENDLKAHIVKESPYFYVEIKDNTLTGRLEFIRKTDTIKSASGGEAGVVKTHNYYYSFYVRFKDIPENSKLNFYAGFGGHFKEFDYDRFTLTSENSRTSEWRRISGLINSSEIGETFGVMASCTDLGEDCAIDVAHPMLIDITESFGNNPPSLEELDNLDYFTYNKVIEEGEIETYRDSLSLNWNGLTIGAQNDVLQLTSNDGLVIYQPDPKYLGTSITNDALEHKIPKLQFGTWTANGNRRYGMRGMNSDGDTIFEISQKGLFLSYGAGTSYFDEEEDADNLFAQLQFTQRGLAMAVTEEDLATGIKNGVELKIGGRGINALLTATDNKMAQFQATADGFLTTVSSMQSYTKTVKTGDNDFCSSYSIQLENAFQTDLLELRIKGPLKSRNGQKVEASDEKVGNAVQLGGGDDLTVTIRGTEETVGENGSNSGSRSFTSRITIKNFVELNVDPNDPEIFDEIKIAKGIVTLIQRVGRATPEETIMKITTSRSNNNGPFLLGGKGTNTISIDSYYDTGSLEATYVEKAGMMKDAVSSTLFETKINQTAYKISLTATQLTNYVNGEVKKLEGQIEVTAEKVGLSIVGDYDKVLAAMGIIVNRDDEGNYTGTTGYINADKIAIKSKNFNVETNGNVSMTGKVTATSGSIAGWEITPTDLYNNNGNGSAGIGKVGTSYAFWAGTTYANRNSAPYRVGHDGSLYATKATISGNVTATSGSIGGISIDANGISYTGGRWNGFGLWRGGIHYTAKPDGYNDYIIFHAGASSANIGGNYYGEMIKNDATGAPVRLFQDGTMYIRDIFTSGHYRDNAMGVIKTGNYRNDGGSIEYEVIQDNALRVVLYGNPGTTYSFYPDAISDTKMKTDIADSTVRGLDTILKIRHIEFNWKDGHGFVGLGYSANQLLEEVNEDFVYSVKQEPGSEYDSILTLRRSEIIPYVTKSIQELYEEINDLKEEIKILKGGK